MVEVGWAEHSVLHLCKQLNNANLDKARLLCGLSKNMVETILGRFNDFGGRKRCL
jgi:hypothetical protein